MDRRVDLTIALLMVGFGVWMYVMAGGIRQGTVVDPVGTAGMIRLLAIILAGGGVILSIQRLRGLTRNGASTVAAEGKADDPGYPASSMRALGMGGLSLLYTLLLPALGYLLLTPPFIGAGIWIMGVRSLGKIVAFALIFTVIVHLVFVALFGVLLPLGPLDTYNRILWFRFL